MSGGCDRWVLGAGEWRVIATLRSFCSGWGVTYLAQLFGGRLRFPLVPSGGGPLHFMLLVANHFEPYSEGRTHRQAVEIIHRWCAGLEALGVKDGEGHPFKHTYFFPAEQYHADFLGPLVDHCAAGFGEVEVHLHHGEPRPDTPGNLERTLRDFVNSLVGHGCLARERRTGRVGYAFVHGNWALANSGAGRACGVDEEMEILARTGCYLDCTLPSAPDRSQVAVINAIYQCGHPHTERACHRSGPRLAAAGGTCRLPVLLQGPLLIDWGRRVAGVPVPRLENGDLTAEYPPSAARFRRWARAMVQLDGRPEWIFIKLHAHGLVERHREALIGVPMRRTLDEVLERYSDGRLYQVHFVTAREAANIIFAAVDGQQGDPGQFRDYRFTPLEDHPCPQKRPDAGAGEAGNGR